MVYFASFVTIHVLLTFYFIKSERTALYQFLIPCNSAHFGLLFNTAQIVGEELEEEKTGPPYIRTAFLFFMISFLCCIYFSSNKIKKKKKLEHFVLHSVRLKFFNYFFFTCFFFRTFYNLDISINMMK